jgi:uncharacterized protein YbjQ (UPF0145 family)
VQQSRWSAGNVEVSGYTDLVTRVRADAREQLDRRVGQFGGDGCVGVRATLNIWDHEAGEGHRDHIAESVFSGTAIVRFRKRSVAEPALPVLALRPLSSRGPSSDRRRRSPS